MVDDLLLNRTASLERALLRVAELYGGDAGNLEHQMRLDAIVLGLQRACENSIDAAMHLVRTHRLGVPQETREAFDLLERAHLLTPELASAMKTWVAFRIVMVHEHEKLTAAEVREMLVEHLGDLRAFAALMIRYALGDSGALHRRD